MQDNRKTLLWANFVYQLINIQMIVLIKRLKVYLKQLTKSSQDSWSVLLKSFRIKIYLCNNLS